MHKIIIGTLICGLLTSLLFAQDDNFFEAHTTIGGYGELHYNAQYSAKDNHETLDFHRIVLFVAHSFSEKWSLKSEFELEHNFVEAGEPGGEIALEQAFINYQFNNNLAFQAGVLLVGVGLINEFHEPPLFLSVERPDYAKYIIPSTWYGNGVSAMTTLRGFDIKAVVMEGLIADKFRAKDGIRAGRQHGYKSDARHLLYNLRADFNGLANLKIGGAIVYNQAAYNDGQTVPSFLTEIHARYETSDFIFMAEAGRIRYDTNVDGFPLNVSQGGYLDVGYDWSSLLGLDGKIISWMRFTDLNPAANTIHSKDNRFRKKMIGISVKPVPGIVFKADFGKQTYFNGRGATTLFNLGMGYMF